MKEIRKLTNKETIELRAFTDEESSKRFLTGYAAVFNSQSKMIVERHNNKTIAFYEFINRSAFDRVLEKNEDTLAVINHNKERMLGRTSSGTLKLETDDKGLKFTLDVPDTQEGRDLWIMVERGDYSECSFAFLCEKDEWERGSELPHRTIQEVSRLIDISIVTNGAYSQTSVATSAERSISELYDNEDSHIIENEHKRLKLELLSL